MTSPAFILTFSFVLTIIDLTGSFPCVIMIFWIYQDIQFQEANKSELNIGHSSENRKSIRIREGEEVSEN